MGSVLMYRAPKVAVIDVKQALQAAGRQRGSLYAPSVSNYLVFRASHGVRAVVAKQ